MHDIRVGEGQDLPHKTGIGLSRTVIPILNVVGLTFNCSETAMGINRDDELTDFPQITETLTPLIMHPDVITDELTEDPLTAISNDVG